MHGALFLFFEFCLRLLLLPWWPLADEVLPLSESMGLSETQPLELVLLLILLLQLSLLLFVLPVQFLLLLLTYIQPRCLEN